MSAKGKSPAEGKGTSPPRNEDIARGFDETADCTAARF
jgi:hypothetical protein